MIKKNEKLKVSFFINGFGEGGAEKQCAYLINELQKDKNFEISLLYFFEGPNFRLLNQNNIQLFKIPSASLYSIKNIPLVNNVINRIKPDIVFSWMQAPDVLSFFVKLRFPKVKWIIAERNSKYRRWDFRFILRVMVGRFANAIICNAEEGKLYWKKKCVSERKITVIPNILYTPEANKTEVKPIITGSPIVLFAGRLEVQKNVIVLTKAFCKLADKFKEGRFYIIGKGSLKDSIAQIIQQNDKTNQVILLPFQNNIYDFFSAADIFVSISHYEGLPNAVIENIALNKKMVISGISQHKNILGASFPYYVNGRSNTDEICDMIENALKDENFSIHFQHGKKFVNSLNPDVITNQYKKYFSYIKA